jgi:hypothetical protein
LGSGLMNDSQQCQPDNQTIKFVFHGSFGRSFTELIPLSSEFEVYDHQTKNVEDDRYYKVVRLMERTIATYFKAPGFASHGGLFKRPWQPLAHSLWPCPTPLA